MWLAASQFVPIWLPEGWRVEANGQNLLPPFVGVKLRKTNVLEREVDETNSGLTPSRKKFRSCSAAVKETYGALVELNGVGSSRFPVRYCVASRFRVGSFL